jgi:hypothetical protein
MTLFFKKREIGFPHAVKGMGFKDRVTDKIIGLAGSITAEFTRGVTGPECRTATFTHLACQPLRLKIFQLVFFFEHEKSRSRLYS